VCSEYIVTGRKTTWVGKYLHVVVLPVMCFPSSYELLHVNRVTQNKLQ